MRILYFGIPLGAIILTRAGFAPAAAMVGPLDLPGRRRLRRQLPKSLPLGLPDTEDPVIRKTLEGLQPDLILSFFWPRKIPAEVLALAPAVGTHPSLLPRWRGPDPYYWAIASGDAVTGVTLHRLEAEYDTGAIVASRTVPISDDDDAWSLAKKLDRPALELLVEAATLASCGDALHGTPQGPSVTFAPVPSADDLAIDWTAAAPVVARRVRAASPAPGASADLGGQEVWIRRAPVSIEAAPAGLRPAEAWRSSTGWCVRCGQGAVRLDDVRDDAGVCIDPDALLRS